MIWVFLRERGGEVSKKYEGATEYAIKQAGDRYHPVIIDREAGDPFEIRNPLTGGILS